MSTNQLTENWAERQSLELTRTLTMSLCFPLNCPPFFLKVQSATLSKVLGHSEDTGMELI